MGWGVGMGEREERGMREAVVGVGGWAAGIGEDDDNGADAIWRMRWMLMRKAGKGLAGIGKV